MVIKNPTYKAMAISSLCNALLQDSDPNVRCSAAEALGKIRSEQAIPTLSQALNDKNADVRRKAVEALGKIGGKKKMSDNRTINMGSGIGHKLRN